MERNRNYLKLKSGIKQEETIPPSIYISYGQNIEKNKNIHKEGITVLSYKKDK